MKKRKTNPLDREWDRVCSSIMDDSVRVKVPRAFLSILTLFFHHVSDALCGDDRPDHGLAMMRRGKEHYRVPFYFLYGKLKRAEKKMLPSHHRKALQLFYRYHELSEARERQFQERLKQKQKPGQHAAAG